MTQPTQQPNSDVLQQDNLDITNIDLFIELKGFKPLSEKELHRGKSLKIYGTQNDMPWNTIYNRMASGQPLSEIGKQYGHLRKLVLWAKMDGVTLDQQTQDIIKREQTIRKEIIEVANDDPEKAKTLLDRVNEVSPDFQQNVALFADKLLIKATEKLNDKFLEPQDFTHLATAVQKVTDTVGITQRHSGGININNNSLAIPEGFGLIAATPPADWNPDEIMAEAHDIALEPVTPSNDALEPVTPITDDTTTLEAVTDE